MLKRTIAIAALGFAAMSGTAGAQIYPGVGGEGTTRNPIAPTQVSNESLPRTGDDSTMPLARTGLILLAAGGGVVLATRRRKSVDA
jgi:LPXTG-motif cell wall-anchored protein